MPPCRSENFGVTANPRSAHVVMAVQFAAVERSSGCLCLILAFGGINLSMSQCDLGGAPSSACVALHYVLGARDCHQD